MSSTRGPYPPTPATHRYRRRRVSPLIDVCALEDLPPGAHKLVTWEDLEIGVFNCDGELLAIEDRCSHDDGELLYGEVDVKACTVECPRHGSRFDLRTGRPLTLPAYEPVETFPVLVEDGMVRLEVD
jgi:3-phenylpropionate/trans-cinnamate dioxygenase ferredoxin subunit